MDCLIMSTAGYYLKYISSESFVLALMSCIFIFNGSVFLYLYIKSYMIKIKEVRKNSLNYYIFRVVDSAFYHYILCF